MPRPCVLEAGTKSTDRQRIYTTLGLSGSCFFSCVRVICLIPTKLHLYWTSCTDMRRKRSGQRERGRWMEWPCALDRGLWINEYVRVVPYSVVFRRKTGAVYVWCVSVLEGKTFWGAMDARIRAITPRPLKPNFDILPCTFAENVRDLWKIIYCYRRFYCYRHFIVIFIVSKNITVSWIIILHQNKLCNASRKRSDDPDVFVLRSSSFKS